MESVPPSAAACPLGQDELPQQRRSSDGFDGEFEQKTCDGGCVLVHRCSATYFRRLSKAATAAEIEESRAMDEHIFDHNPLNEHPDLAEQSTVRLKLQGRGLLNVLQVLRRRLQGVEDQGGCVPSGELEYATLLLSDVRQRWGQDKVFARALVDVDPQTQRTVARLYYECHDILGKWRAARHAGDSARVVAAAAPPAPTPAPTPA